jgi:hypothetical protein
MKTLKLLIALTIGIAIESCIQHSYRETNFLLAKDVTVAYWLDLQNKRNEEWTHSLQSKMFLDNTFNAILSGKVSIYSPEFRYGSKEPFTAPQVRQLMEWKGNEIETSSIKQIIFYEKWKLNSKQQFIKEVVGWCPIVLFPRTGNNDEERRRVFYAYPIADKEWKNVALFGKDVFTEFSFLQEVPPPNEYTGLSKQELFNYLYTNIKDGKIIAYDPIYMVDKSKRKMTIKQIEDYCQFPFTVFDLMQNVDELIFEEDWYFDSSTLAIYKNVKSIALIKLSYNNNGSNTNKKIMFFVFFKD